MLCDYLDICTGCFSSSTVGMEQVGISYIYICTDHAWWVCHVDSTHC